MDILEPNRFRLLEEIKSEDDEICSSAGDLKSVPNDHEHDPTTDEEQLICSNAMLGMTYSADNDDELLTKRNLIVNYLPQTFTDCELYNMFSPFGALDSVRIMKDVKTGYSFGFGFVNFTNEEEAIVAQSAMNGFEVASKQVKCSFARPPSDDIKHTNLYITNLPRNITEEELIQIFKPFGPIIQKKLLRDKYTNLPRGVAFIRYEKRAQASTAIMKLNNCIPSGCVEPIRIRLAEDHGKQKAAYLAGFQAGMVVPRHPPQGQEPSVGGGKRKGGGKSRSRNSNNSRSKQYSRVRKRP